MIIYNLCLEKRISWKDYEIIYNDSRERISGEGYDNFFYYFFIYQNLKFL